MKTTIYSALLLLLLALFCAPARAQVGTSTAFKIRSGTGDPPATCIKSDVYVKTGVTPAEIFVCRNTDDWDEMYAAGVQIAAANVAPGTNGQCLTTAGGVTTWGACATAGAIAGLTANFIPKANSATALVNSIVQEDGTNMILGSGTFRMLANNVMIKGRNAANSADIDLVGTNASNQVVVGSTVFYESSPAFSTLTDGANITWTFAATSKSQNATVTLGGNRNLDLAGLTAGATGTVIVKQDATGSRTLTLGGTDAYTHRVIGGGTGAVTLTSTANAVDILTFIYDGSHVYWNYGKNYN